MSNTFICEFCKVEQVLREDFDDLDSEEFYFNCSGCSKDGLKSTICCNNCESSIDFYDGPTLCPMYIKVDDIYCSEMTRDRYIEIFQKRYRDLVLSIVGQKPFELYGEEYQVVRTSRNIKSAIK